MRRASAISINQVDYLLTFHSRDWKCGFWAKTWRLMPLVHISCLITKPLACSCACALFIALQLVNLLWRYIGEVTYSWNTKRHMGSVRSKGCVAPCTYSELDFAAAKCYNFTVYTLTANFFLGACLLKQRSDLPIQWEQLSAFRHT